MEWSARRRFLRLALPLRIGPVAGGLFVFYGLYGFSALLLKGWQEGLISGWRDFQWIFPFQLDAARGILVLWMCWLYWKLADAMVATAGGTSSSMEEWSRIQNRLVWAMIIATVISLLSVGWGWLLPDFLPAMPLSE